MSADVWRKRLDYLGRSRRVIAIDPRGQGRSGAAPMYRPRGALPVSPRSSPGSASNASFSSAGRSA